MPTELVFASGVAWRPPAQVRRPLTNCEVEAFDERRVQGLGILRLQQRVLQAPCCADLKAPFDANDTIVPPHILQRYLRRRPDFVVNQPWPPMLMPCTGWPSSLKCSALKNPRFTHRLMYLRATDQQRTEQAPPAES